MFLHQNKSILHEISSKFGIKHDNFKMKHDKILTQAVS